MKLLTLAAIGALTLTAVQAFAEDDTNATSFEKTTTSAYTTTQQTDNNIEPAAGPKTTTTSWQSQTSKSYAKGSNGTRFQQPSGIEKTRSNEATPEESE